MNLSPDLGNSYKMNVCQMRQWLLDYLPHFDIVFQLVRGLLHGWQYFLPIKIYFVPLHCLFENDKN